MCETGRSLWNFPFKIRNKKISRKKYFGEARMADNNEGQERQPEGQERRPGSILRFRLDECIITNGQLHFYGQRRNPLEIRQLNQMRRYFNRNRPLFFFFFRLRRVLILVLAHVFAIFIFLLFHKII